MNTGTFLNARLAMLAAFLSIASSCTAESNRTHGCDWLARPPVIYVHGSGLTSSTWDPMRTAFMAAGAPNTLQVSLDLQPRDGANALAAESFIAPAVEAALSKQEQLLAAAHCAASPLGKVDLVSHSMGAVSARWYTARIAPHRVRTFVSIAGANHGTSRLCGRAGLGDRELCLAGDEDNIPSVLNLLNGTADLPLDETPCGTGPDSADRERIRPSGECEIRYFTIRMDPDEWIDPPSSAELDGAGDDRTHSTGFPAITETSPGNFEFRGQATHDDLPAHPEIIRFVRFLLDDDLI